MKSISDETPILWDRRRTEQGKYLSRPDSRAQRRFDFLLRERPFFKENVEQRLSRSPQFVRSTARAPHPPGPSGPCGISVSVYFPFPSRANCSIFMRRTSTIASNCNPWCNGELNRG